MDERLGKYRLVAELARGGMAIAWLAEMRGPGGFVKHFVVKELLPNLARDDEHRAMFLDEARLAARLAHPNIVETIDLDHDGERWFIVLELLHGCSLDRARKLVSPRRMPVGVAVKIVRDLLDGLHHAHELRDETGKPLRIVHRDLSARNVFLTTSGEVKLLDFGLAKSADRGRRTEPGMVKGSVNYLSPEHVGDAPLDRRSDVFAAGILLRELLLGERVWDGLDEASVLRGLLARAIPPFPRERARDVPDELIRICERAMAPYRVQRFATAAEMRDALDAWRRNAGDATSASELAKLFDGELAVERDRARLLLRANPSAPDALADDERVTLPAPAALPVTKRLASPVGKRTPRRALALGAALVVSSLMFASALVPHLVDTGEADDEPANAVASCAVD